MPIMKITRGKNGVAYVDTVDTGERRLSASERARLQLIEEQKDREEAEDRAKRAGPGGASLKGSEALTHPGRADEVDETDRSDERSPRAEVVSTDRIEAALGQKTVPGPVDQPTGRQADWNQKRDTRPDPDAMSVARMVEAGLGPDPDAHDTTVLDQPDVPPETTDPAFVKMGVGQTACPICGKEARKPSGLASHMRARHPDVEIHKTEE